MEKVEVDGLEIAYEQRGDGPPLVLLHGYVGDSRTWRAQLDGLSDEFTVLAWDAPGFGGSSDPPENFRLPEYADCLAGFIRALDLQKAHVGGVSFGGGLALELYRRHPSVLRSLILVSAYAGWAGSLPADEVDRRLHQALQLAELSSDELTRVLLPTMFTPSTPQHVADELAAMLADFRPSGLRATARAFAEADLREVLPRIDVPTLLVYGDQDVRAGVPVGEDLHDRIPGSRLEVMTGVGHGLNLEVPERFNSEVRGFLRSMKREKATR